MLGAQLSKAQCVGSVMGWRVPISFGQDVRDGGFNQGKNGGLPFLGDGPSDKLDTRSGWKVDLWCFRPRPTLRSQAAAYRVVGRSPGRQDHRAGLSRSRLDS